MNNEEAEVKVTQEIPLVTGQYTSSTAAVNGTTSPFQTIQREEVGTILKVTPHISEGDTIQLKVEQEDSSPGAKLANSADISTNKRSIKTTILIEDGGIIVLGGLMQDTVTESEDRVPVLGAIPLLGNLFKSRSGSRQKSNLLVFLRPKILRDQPATEAVSDDEIQRNPRGGARSCTRARSRCCRARSSPRSRRDPARQAPADGNGLDRRPAPQPAPSPADRAVGAGRPAARSPHRRARSRRPRMQPAPAAQPAPAPQPPRRRSRSGPQPLPRHERRTQNSRPQRKLSFPFAKRHGVLVRGIAERLRRYRVPPGRHPAGSRGGAPLRRRAA